MAERQNIYLLDYDNVVTNLRGSKSDERYLKIYAGEASRLIPGLEEDVFKNQVSEAMDQLRVNGNGEAEKIRGQKYHPGWETTVDVLLGALRVFKGLREERQTLELLQGERLFDLLVHLYKVSRRELEVMFDPGAEEVLAAFSKQGQVVIVSGTEKEVIDKELNQLLGSGHEIQVLGEVKKSIVNLEDELTMPNLGGVIKRLSKAGRVELMIDDQLRPLEIARGCGVEKTALKIPNREWISPGEWEDYHRPEQGQWLISDLRSALELLPTALS